MPKKDCSELSKVLTRLALNIGEQEGMNTLDDVLTEMQRHLPEITRETLVNSIAEATTGHRQVIDDISARLGALKREARSDVNARRKISELEAHLKQGTLPEKRLKPEYTTEAVRRLRAAREAVRAAVSKSEPAVKQRLLDQIDALAERLEDVAEVPSVKRAALPSSKELDRLTYQRDRLRRQLRAKIAGMKPRTFWARAGDIANIPRTLKSSVDFSAVLRQGGFIVLGHPIRGLRGIGPMLRAFSSERRAERIMEEIETRPNAPMYARSGLYIAPLDGSLAQREEAFMSRLAGKIPVVAGSQRAYVVFLNRLRADSFDAMAETLSITGDPTLEEAQAVSNFINVATGRSSLKSGDVGAFLSTALFSPRFVASRFQLLAGQPLWRGPASARKLVAQEYARYLAGLAVVYALGALAGAEVEKDPRSSDFGKLKFDDTRIDPLSGISQTTVFSGRLATGEFVSQTGRVRPLAERDIFRFLRYKLSPFIGAVVNLRTGKDPIGREVGPGDVALDLVEPIAVREVYEIMREHGFTKGAALSILEILGAGVQVYD